MQITSGKYKTRNGLIATVNNEDRHCRHGLIYTGEIISVGINAWYESGAWLESGAEHGFDLVERMPEESHGYNHQPEDPHYEKPECISVQIAEEAWRRDIAQVAMKSLIICGHAAMPERIADLSYQIADAMIARSKIHAEK